MPIAHKRSEILLIPSSQTGKSHDLVNWASTGERSASTFTWLLVVFTFLWDIGIRISVSCLLFSGGHPHSLAVWTILVWLLGSSKPGREGLLERQDDTITCNISTCILSLLLYSVVQKWVAGPASLKGRDYTRHEYEEMDHGGHFRACSLH